MNLVLFDDQSRENLLPLSYTRPLADIRVGITTIREKWEAYNGSVSSTKTEEYLSIKFPLHLEEINLFINGAVFPDEDLYNTIQNLNVGEGLIKDGVLIAAMLEKENANDFTSTDFTHLKTSVYESEFLKINHPWDLFTLNGKAIELDFQRITNGRTSVELDETNQIKGEKLFVEKGGNVANSIINTETGPVYIGKNAEIMEGSLIRGPFAICEGSQVKMGAKIYGPTTVGPYSKIGGEVNNCIILGYSNKGHDGFLGNSVIGEWCNLGADTNNSNLKNNYGQVKLWNYSKEDMVDTELQFCGLIMGDHSKCGINTMFNTGTVIGVSANVFGAGFPNKFIPSFSWGGAEGLVVFDQEKAFELAQKMMDRRGLEFSNTDKQILCHIFDISKKYRS